MADIEEPLLPKEVVTTVHVVTVVAVVHHLTEVVEEEALKEVVHLERQERLQRRICWDSSQMSEIMAYHMPLTSSTLLEQMYHNLQETLLISCVGCHR